MPKSSGQIVELLVSQGDTVEAGQPLARLESKDQQLALDAERAGLSKQKMV
ncbi:biotin/lipoyl-binding protein [Anaerobacillus sp. HL2]|nr:biotin/lipoyl-binding protein [Anaerobacillus sp. HL2]